MINLEVIQRKLLLWSLQVLSKTKNEVYLSFKYLTRSVLKEITEILVFLFK